MSTAKYIADNDKLEFTEIGSGQKLAIDKAKIRKTFLLTVSLYNLAGIATTLAVFQDLKLFRDNEYPFAVSIADLEFITEFCDCPDVMLHYVEKRLEIQKLDIPVYDY